MLAPSLSPGLWKPQENGVRKTIESLEKGRVPILQGPTGCGKTRMATELMLWAEAQGIPGVFYVNRNLLINQTARRFGDAGLDTGVRSAYFPEQFDAGAPYQVASIQTEASRVWKNGKWNLHDAGLVVVDEAHIQRTGAMETTLSEYRRRGAKIVLLTATPVDMIGWADDIIISGSMQEYRDCGALVMADVKGVEAPDMSKVKRNPVGEYVINGEKRKIYQQQIAGNVIDNWKRFNPDARPALGFAPGKPESVYMVNRFAEIGSRWVHVDATDAYFDGKKYKLNHSLWHDICEMHKDGSIHGIWSRFKLREGVDLPHTYHAILATPIGSLASYIQTIGRVLRRSPETPDIVLVTDHGGNYLTHGSPNADRPWDEYAWMGGHYSSTAHQKDIESGRKPHSIVCHKCLTERPAGEACPRCGTIANQERKHWRYFREEDARLVSMPTDKKIPVRRVKRKSDTQSVWNQMYFGYCGKKVNQNFNNLYAWFRHEHGYYPPMTLANMPVNQFDWNKVVYTVPRDALR